MSSEDATPDSDTNSQSDPSTLVYDHEPFDTFKARVLELASNVLNTANGELSIERMQGGGFNRIIGISVTNENGASTDQYVLRIPRFEAASLNRDLAPLQLLRQQSEIHVPEVVAFDTTTRNALESPYMIQKRISGSSLFPDYPSLPHDMKCTITKELGKVYFEMHSINSVTAGRLTLQPDQESLMIQPFGDTAANALVQYENGQAAKTTSELLRLLLTYQKEQAAAEGPNQSFRISFFDQFLATASEMNALGVLNGKSYCLCHLDLEPRNILAVTPSPNQPYAITGILDWDSAIFAPPLISCAPPMWIWAWNDEDDEDERFADNTPSTPEFAELKTLFEEAAGPTYRRFAYGAQYRLARKLFKFALDGLQTNEDMMDAESLLSEWAQVQHSLNPANNDAAEPQLDLPIAPPPLGSQ
ncbi:phosphotransferase family protein [Aspergillus stella-maris]|uniref:phosphotransferase family protein n=1 Tax=Aspergillus stella-maris TaxID=1810926 RepID=UPI003CCD4FBE